MQWQSGALSRITFATNFHALITGTGSKRIEGACTNLGIMEWQSPGPITSADLNFQNYGQLVVETNFYAEPQNPLPGIFNNFGIIMVRSNFGTIPMPVSWNFTNYGIVRVETNSLLQIYPANGTQMYFVNGSLFDGEGAIAMPNAETFSWDGVMTLNCTLHYAGAAYSGQPYWIGPGQFFWEGAGMSDFTFGTNFHVIIQGPEGKYMSGNCTNHGVVRWSTPGSFGSPGATFYNDGQFVIEAGTDWENNVAFVNQPGGALRHSAIGQSSAFMVLTNRGLLELDKGLLLFPDGAFSADNGSYQLNLDGYTAGTGFGQLSANSLTLGGSLIVTLTNGFAPTNGSSFTIATANALSGQFTSLTLPALPSSLAWRVEYLSDRVVLRVIPPLQWNGFAFTNTAFQLSLNGPAANAYDILASTNLTDWITIETNAPFPGSLIFTDTNAAQFNRRFYRARIYN